MDIVGFATRIDLHAYDVLHERIKAALPKAKHRYFEPYPKVFEMQLQFILRFARDKYPLAERVNFVFDEQDQFAGRAADLVALHRKNPDLPDRDRIGTVTHGVSSDLIPLQVADLIAYEVHRQFRHAPVTEDQIRWQSIRLSEGGRVNVAYLDETAIEAWANLYPKESA